MTQGFDLNLFHAITKRPATIPLSWQRGLPYFSPSPGTRLRTHLGTTSAKGCRTQRFEPQTVTDRLEFYKGSDIDFAPLMPKVICFISTPPGAQIFFLMLGQL